MNKGTKQGKRSIMSVKWQPSMHTPSQFFLDHELHFPGFSTVFLVTQFACTITSNYYTLFNEENS